MADYAKDVLVDTDWVEEHLNDDSIRIVEVDENPALYAEAHIPGAIGFDWKTDLQDQVKRDFLGPEEFGELFGSRGISNDHTIVLLRGPEQLVRGLHVLVPRVLRPRQREARQRAAREVDLRGPPDDHRPPRPRRHDVHGEGRRRHDPRQARRGPRARSATARVLVDVRSPQEFSGELIAMAGYEQEGAQRAGHIPGGAKSIPWAQVGQGGRHVQVGRRPGPA